jgi:hypothetical protein
VASLSLSLDTGGDGLNWLISFEVNLGGKPFQDMKFWICFNSLFRRVALLQILWARFTRARIQAIFLDQGVKLDMWEY